MIRAGDVMTTNVTSVSPETPVEELISLLRVSHFTAVPVADAEGAMAWVKGRSDAKARHNCFAWRLPGGETRTNGDGEPGGGSACSPEYAAFSPHRAA